MYIFNEINATGSSTGGLKSSEQLMFNPFWSVPRSYIPWIPRQHFRERLERLTLQKTFNTPVTSVLRGTLKLLKLNLHFTHVSIIVVQISLFGSSCTVTICGTSTDKWANNQLNLHWILHDIRENSINDFQISLAHAVLIWFFSTCNFL